MPRKINRARRAEIVRNRILFVFMMLIIILVVAIAFNASRNRENIPANLPVSQSQSQTASTPGSSSGSSSSASPSSQVSSQASSQPSSQSASTGAIVSSQSASSSTASSQPDPADKYYEAALPLLVNADNKIPADFVADVEDMGNNYRFDRHAMTAYKDMLAAAQADGISLWVLSAYRSNEKQQTNFDAKVKEYQNQGYDAQQAFAATAQLIAVPGTSEHSIGLAIDFNSLYTNFEETAAFRWLYANCADYGFILRYPKDKVEITKISYEPWHYRYVGSNHARVIMDKGICLEEYLGFEG